MSPDLILLIIWAILLLVLVAIVWPDRGKGYEVRYFVPEAGTPLPLPEGLRFYVIDENVPLVCVYGDPKAMRKLENRWQRGMTGAEARELVYRAREEALHPWLHDEL